MTEFTRKSAQHLLEFSFPQLTYPAGVRGSPCLSWFADAAGSERPLGWMVPDSVRCATGRDMTPLLGDLETLASARGCGGSGSLSADWKGPWRRLDWSQGNAGRPGPILGQRVPYWGPPLSKRFSWGGPGWSASIGWGPGCPSSVLFPLCLHSVSTADCSKGNSLIYQRRQTSQKTTGQLKIMKNAILFRCINNIHIIIERIV